MNIGLIVNGGAPMQPKEQVLKSLRSKGWQIQELDNGEFKVKGHRLRYYLEGLCVLDAYPHRWQPES